MRTTRSRFGSGRLIPSILLLAAILAHAAQAATLTVTSLADSGPGTLRDRIAAAAPGDTINFGISGTLVLASPLTISTNLRVEGPGVQFLTLSGSQSTRIFNITGGNVGIFRMVIANGRVTGTNGAVGMNGENVGGGAIRVSAGAMLGMSAVILSNNVAAGGNGGSQNQFGGSGNGGNAFGGAIANYGSLTLVQFQMIGNSAVGGNGGPVTDGAFPGVGGQAWGGGIYSEGSGFVSQCTLHLNQAIAGTGLGGPGGGSGGAIYNVSDLTLYLATVTSNSASGSSFDFGGAAYSVGSLFVREATIVGNQADFGGGLGGSADIGNSILAGNSAGTGPEGSGSFISADYNLIQSTNGMSFTGPTTRTLVGQNPLLGPLKDNGGFDLGFSTLTLLPLPGSPVIDKGNSPGGHDQRGKPRPFDTGLANAVNGTGSDIGAVEIVPGTLLVLNTNNSGPGSLRQALADNSGLGGGNTITFSNSVTGTIPLSVELTLAMPAFVRGPGPDQLAISGNNSNRVFTVLQGPSEISGLTLRNGFVAGSQGNQGQNGFDGRGAGIFNQATLTLSNCVVLSNKVIGGIGGERHLGSVGNGGKGRGGGIFNAGGSLTLIDVHFRGNSAFGGQGGPALNNESGGGGNGDGAAISTISGTNKFVRCSFADGLAAGGAGGTLSGSGTVGPGGQGYGGAYYSESVTAFTNCTISGNSASGTAGGSGSGGGIYNVSELNLHLCTIASNNASGSTFDFGGGIYDVGTLTLFNSTVAGNAADFGGGLQGDATAGNSIFAANAATTMGADVNGTLNSWDYNLIQSFGGLNILGATGHVIVGANPQLGPLADNGGPTQTMVLRPNSPALDQGFAFGAATDQRGAPRQFDFNVVANAGGGDGSDIGAFELGQPVLKISGPPADAMLSWPAYYGDFTLESATALGIWNPVPAEPTIAAGEFVVPHGPMEGNRFFRLISD